MARFLLVLALVATSAFGLAPVLQLKPTTDRTVYVEQLTSDSKSTSSGVKALHVLLGDGSHVYRYLGDDQDNLDCGSMTFFTSNVSTVAVNNKDSAPSGSCSASSASSVRTLCGDSREVRVLTLPQSTLVPGLDLSPVGDIFGRPGPDGPDDDFPPKGWPPGEVIDIDLDFDLPFPLPFTRFYRCQDYCDTCRQYLGYKCTKSIITSTKPLSTQEISRRCCLYVPRPPPPLGCCTGLPCPNRTFCNPSNCRCTRFPF